MGEYDKRKTETPETSGVGINDALDKNLNEFKAEMAVWLHDLELPEHGVLSIGDFMKATEIKQIFEKFRKSIQTQLENL